MGVSWARAMAVIARKARVNLGLIRIDSSQIMFEQRGRQEAGYHATTGDRGAILPLPDMSHQERSLLDMAGTTPAQQFVTVERGLDGGLARYALGKDHRIFDRHATALSQIRRAGVGGIAQKSHSASRPARQRRKIVGAVFQNQVRGFDQRGNR